MITIHYILIREIVDNICKFLKLGDIISFHSAFYYPLSDKWLVQYNKEYREMNNNYINVFKYFTEAIKIMYCNNCDKITDINYVYKTACIDCDSKRVCDLCAFKCANCNSLICSTCLKDKIKKFGLSKDDRSDYPLSLICFCCLAFGDDDNY